MIFLKHDRTEMKWTVALTLVIPVWMGFAPEWYLWYGKKDNWLWMKCIYDLLNNLWLVNIPICIVLGYFVFRWCRLIWKDNDCRLFRFLLVVIGLFILYWKSNVVYAHILWLFDYRMFLIILLLFTLSLMFYKALKTIKFDRNKQNDNFRIKGFSNDNVEKSDISESLKSFASLIVERLTASSMNKNSWTVGIIGEWGVGKTTFLDLLKEQIGSKADVVVFNPWMCRTPEQVIRDFFASLRNQLAPKHSTLSKSIKEYSKYLNAISYTPLTSFGFDMKLSVGESSLYEKKKRLSEKLSDFSHPVVVIIDDLDRLERNEIFEVLRLIRNTADLANMIYIVAYDKEYVTAVLKEQNINDPSSYLEKIFQVEVCLPKMDDYLIWKVLISDFNAQDSFKGTIVKSLCAQLDYYDRALILRIIDNFRRAKRFARLYMLNVCYLNERSRGEILFVDLLWLELLQMYDIATYDKLANDPGCLLNHNEERFFIRDEILCDVTAQNEKEYVGQKFWKEETLHILEKMFGHSTKKEIRRICYLDNYNKYFALGVSPYKLSISEMNELFTDGANPEEVVSKWVDSKKNYDSIAYQMKQVDLNVLKEGKHKIYLQGLLYLGMKAVYCHHNFLWEVKRILWLEQYNENVIENTRKAVLSIVQSWTDILTDEKKFLSLSRLLQEFYVTIFFCDNSQQKESHWLVISNDDVEKLLVNVMIRYLNAHKDISALDLMKENSSLSSLFRNCCLTVKEYILQENDFECKQVAFDVVINYFANKEVKPTLKEYNNAYCELFHHEKSEFDSSNEENEYENYMMNVFDLKMKKYFGSSYDSTTDNKLEEFKKKCFLVE